MKFHRYSILFFSILFVSHLSVVFSFAPSRISQHEISVSLVQRHESVRFDGDHGVTEQVFSISAGAAIQRLGSMTGPTVWSQFSKLAQENDVANLGQGFPDWFPPKFAIDRKSVV